jgi:mono/diheme cytochrome c family protein
MLANGLRKTVMRESEVGVFSLQKKILFGLILTLLFVSSADACSRCGIFGRGCRFGHHHVQAVEAVVAAPIIQPPVVSIINNYPAGNGAAATLLAPQGGTVYGLSTAVQAYSLDPAQVLRQAAELTKGAQQLAQQGLTGYGQTAALALTLQASQPAVQAVVSQPIISQPQPQSLTLKLVNGKWEVDSPGMVAQNTAPELPKAPQTLPAGLGGSLVKKYCASCHGSDLATPKGSIFLDAGVALDCDLLVKSVNRVSKGEMPPGGLPLQDRLELIQDLNKLIEKKE